MYKRLVSVVLACSLLVAVPANALFFNSVYKNSSVRRCLRFVGAIGVASYATDRALDMIRLVGTYIRIRNWNPNLGKGFLKESIFSGALSVLSYISAYELFKSVKK